MEDTEENAAMWKDQPIVATAVGGIKDQIEDGVHGLLLHDPTCLDTFGSLLDALLADDAQAQRLGYGARERVRAEYLGVRHLIEYAELPRDADASGLSARAS